ARRGPRLECQPDGRLEPGVEPSAPRHRRPAAKSSGTLARLFCAENCPGLGAPLRGLAGTAIGTQEFRCLREKPEALALPAVSYRKRSRLRCRIQRDQTGRESGAPKPLGGAPKPPCRSSHFSA